MAKIILEQTCFGCPEQYDVFNGQELIGYIRYRWGHLKCNPVVNGKHQFENILFSWENGNPYDGILPDDKREELLEKCKEAICKYHNIEL